MRLIVQKYGGTSVANPERIQNVAKKILQTQADGNQVVVVVSAMSGMTDGLIQLARQVAPHPTEREMDVLLATGEQTTIALTAMAINGMGGHATSLTGAQAGIVTDGVHTRAKIANITPKRIHLLLNSGNIVIVAGFQGESLEGQITTLGRGGSDLTAIALAAAINADLCQIFTDVEGVYTCDPRIVRNAQKIPEISYDEMLEMASLGAKVMQSRAVEFAKKFGVIFEVRSSFNDKPGTMVKEETVSMEKVVIRGVTVDRRQAKVTVSQVPDKPGTASKVFNAISAANLNVDMIVQNVSAAGTTDITFTIQADELPKIERCLGPIVEEIGAKGFNAVGGIAKLSVIGIGMRSHSGIAAKMFDLLGHSGINIQMISTSEIKISVIIDEDRVDEGANIVHAGFGLGAEQ
ncbi:MAG: aspartate kinase [Verrucomicrobia bacterium]|jgi:aspartate kinase|nr:aspartate kinase [Verrucomicrobiota bacterium]